MKESNKHTNTAKRKVWGTRKKERETEIKVVERKRERESESKTQKETHRHFYASSIWNCFLPGPGWIKERTEQHSKKKREPRLKPLEVPREKERREHHKCHLNRRSPNVFANRRAATDATHSSVYFAHKYTQTQQASTHAYIHAYRWKIW